MHINGRILTALQIVGHFVERLTFRRRVTPSIVRSLYRGILGREPENDLVVSSYCDGRSLEEVAAALADSKEAKARRGRYRDDLFNGYEPSDLDRLASYVADPAPETGFVKNFLGAKMSIDTAGFVQSQGGRCYPNFREPDFMSEPIEYLGTAKAVEASRGQLVVAELGAGWGPWIVNAGIIGRHLSRAPIRLYAVEAVPQKVDRLRSNVIANGFSLDQVTIFEGVVGPKDGHAIFPTLDAIHDWGGEASFSRTNEDGYFKVNAISIPTLLRDEPLVDLIHFDIQGAEYEVIRASIQTLSEKVRYLVIGTHSRQIEGEILAALSAHGWILEHEQPARCEYRNGRSAIVVDGTQVLRNPAIE